LFALLVRVSGGRPIIKVAKIDIASNEFFMWETVFCWEWDNIPW
jgi:hypothetical protein